MNGRPACVFRDERLSDWGAAWSAFWGDQWAWVDAPRVIFMTGEGGPRYRYGFARLISKGVWRVSTFPAFKKVGTLRADGRGHWNIYKAGRLVGSTEGTRAGVAAALMWLIAPPERKG